MVPARVLPASVAFMVTVPVPAVKVPLLDQSPPTSKETLEEACRVALAPIETFPSTSNIRSLVSLLKAKEVPPLVKDRLFKTLMSPLAVPLVVMVGVPDELSKVRL